MDRDTIIDNNPNLEFDPYDPFYSPDRSSYQIGIIYYNPGLDQYIRYDGSDADPKFVDITETIVK